nr:uncharacterized protein LOC109730319 [Microcebus murinus]
MSLLHLAAVYSLALIPEAQPLTLLWCKSPRRPAPVPAPASSAPRRTGRGFHLGICNFGLPASTPPGSACVGASAAPGGKRGPESRRCHQRAQGRARGQARAGRRRHRPPGKGDAQDAGVARVRPRRHPRATHQGARVKDKKRGWRQESPGAGCAGSWLLRTTWRKPVPLPGLRGPCPRVLHDPPCPLAGLWPPKCPGEQSRPVGTALGAQHAAASPSAVPPRAPVAAARLGSRPGRRGTQRSRWSLSPLKARPGPQELALAPVFWGQ